MLQNIFAKIILDKSNDYAKKIIYEENGICNINQILTLKSCSIRKDNSCKITNIYSHEIRNKTNKTLE